MSWCEANRVEYVFGLERISRLEAALTDQLAQAKQQLCMSSGKPARVFRRLPLSHGQELEPDTSRGRQGRAHAGRVQSTLCRHLAQNHTRVAYDARALYEDLYCARGKAENRIGEQFEMFADRASSATMSANQLRMSFSAMAYVLVEHFASCRPAPFPVR